jgi:hypothetical protein
MLRCSMRRIGGQIQADLRQEAFSITGRRVLKSGPATPKDRQLDRDRTAAQPDRGCGCLVSRWVWLLVAKLRNISRTAKDRSGPVATSLNVGLCMGLHTLHRYTINVIYIFPMLYTIHLCLIYFIIINMYARAVLEQRRVLEECVAIAHVC